MRKTTLVVEALLLLSILTAAASAIIPIPYEENTDTDMVYVPISEIDEIQITQTNFGPGSEVPWYDPIIKDGSGNYVQGVWLSNVEPEYVTWKFYDPMWHLVYTDVHEPSVKQQGSFESGGKTYKWAYADYTTFTIPAFPPLGDWWGTVEFKLVNDQAHTGAYTYYVKITNGGSFENFFSAPVYFFGIKFPAWFWIIAPFTWIPLLIFLVLVIWGRGLVGAVKIVKNARAAARRARAEWRAEKPKKEKK